jgi:hypothetical protein
MKFLKCLGPGAIAAIALLAVSTASATTLEVGGVSQNKSVAFVMTLAAGSTLTIKDEGGATWNACSASEVKGSTEASFTGASVRAQLSAFTFAGCSHTMKTLKNGSLFIAWTSGTEGTITSTETEVTTVSTVFGVSSVCKTGAGTKLGTLKGVKEGHATVSIDVTNALDCGILGKTSWTGAYTVTSPTGLGVVS